MNKRPIKRLDVARSVQVLDSVGGNSVVKRTCGVSSPCVSQWRKEGIPLPRLGQIYMAFRKVPAVREAVEATIER